MKLLVLLIGGNNIANYALIDYFKKSNEYRYDKVSLVYTTQTKNAALAIKELSENAEFIDIDLGEFGRNVQVIKEKVSKILKNFDVSFIHFNYTGGTKPMSLGTFLAVDKLKCEKLYSDISPDSSKLTFLNGEEYPKKGSIADGVNLDIFSLYKLHGIELISMQKNVSRYYNDELIKILYEKSIKFKEEESFWKIWDDKYKKLKKQNWRDTLDEKFFEVDEFNLKDFQNFIKGRWLEEYVFDVLKDEDFNDIAWNVEGRIKEREFELDLVIVKGHKSYVISCTTASHLRMVKTKAFEASIRAEQIGGIRATPISISLLNDEELEKIYDDVKNYVGKSKFHFIGRNIVGNRDKLKSRILEIIK
jgi:hypothetical protein